jgi:hypothetical protein
MGYACYQVGDRYAGYGVPAYCEHPDCNKEIDRGVSFACGGEPRSEYGCDLYFCGKHLQYKEFNVEDAEANGYDPDGAFVCERCEKSKEEFPYKPEHPEWVYHLLNHESWEEWRNNNPEKVAELKKLPAVKSEDEDYDKRE